MKQETKSHDEQITQKLYNDYQTFKNQIFDFLVSGNPQHDKLTLFKKSQKLLGRFLFILFAEDGGLIPPNAINKIIIDWQMLNQLKVKTSLYERFVLFFGHLDKGEKYDDWGIIPAYNGGLFRYDEILDHPDLKLPDGLLRNNLPVLSNYDFSSEVDVNILGHIFEHSLSEIEELTAKLQCETVDKTKSKRKKDGIFYTPRYITKYIVENTVGKLCKEKKIELQINNLLIDESFYHKNNRLNSKGKELFEILQNYKNWLLTLKILDPACGSGAFLNATLDFLIAKHKEIDNLISELTGDKMRMFDTDKQILENNIFGVDINEESVEIAKLSLWLRTAKCSRILSDLSGNIKCGNSLINDQEIAGGKVFDWNIEFKEIMENSGFDIVIGNPPYVNIANIQDKKERKFYQKNYVTVKNKSDLYNIFVEKSYYLLKKNGLLSFIFPNSWLGTDSFSEFRKFLINKTKVIELVKLPPDVFKDAVVTPIIIIFNKEIVENNLINLKELKNGVFETYNYYLSYDRIKKFDSCTFSFSPEIKINAETVKLGNIAKFSLGIKTSDDKRFILNKKIDDECYLMLRGRDISRYYHQQPKEFIWYKPELMMQRKGAGPRKLENFLKNKILFQGISGGNIISTYEEDNNLCNDAIHILYEIDSNFNLKYVLAILNSEFIRKWFLSAFSKVLGVKINQLQQIPIPVISKEAQQPFVEKANLMLLLNKELQEKTKKWIRNIQREFSLTNFSKKLQNWYKLSYAEFLKELEKQKIKLSLSRKAEWENYFCTESKEVKELSSKINETDNEINKMVNKLYELTPEESKL